MGRKSAKRGRKTFKKNVKAAVDDTCGGCEGNGVDKNDSDDILFDEMTLRELQIYEGKKREVLGVNKGSDDHLFDNMTLQKLKIYGAKKRKILKSAADSNVGSSRKRNHSHIQFDEEEPDTEERTFYQKSRLSKKLKVENEWAEDCSSQCNLRYVGSIKPEQESTLSSVNQDLLAVAMPRTLIKCEPLLYNSGYLCGIDNIKTEILETKSYHLQNAACSAANCFADVNFCELSPELLGRVGSGQLESGKPAHFLEMKESAFFNNEFLQCSLNEASTKYFEDMEESTYSIMNLSGESSDGSSDNFHGGELVMRGSTSFTEETLYCSLNEASTEYMEEMEELTYFTEVMGLSGELSAGFPVLRELETEEPSSTNNESLPCLNEASTHCSEPDRSTFLQEIDENLCSCCPFTSELMIEGLLPSKLSTGSSEEIPELNIPGSETHHDCRSSSSNEILCQVHKNTVTQVSDVAIDDSPQCLDSNDASYGCISGSESEDVGDNVDETPLDSKVPTDLVKDISIVHEDHSTSVTSPQCVESNDASYGCISCSESEDLGDNVDEIPIDCKVPTYLVEDTSTACEDHSTGGTSAQCVESNDASYGCISCSESEDLGDNVVEIPIDCKEPTDFVKDTSIAHEYYSTSGTNGPYSSTWGSKDSVTASDNFFYGCSPQDSKHSVFVDESIKSSIRICPSNGTLDLNPMESFDNVHGEKLKHPPERLLSTRKAISPPCQEKLCLADMTPEELYEGIEISNYRRRLWFEKRTKASMTGVVLNEADVMMGHDGVIKKLNGDNGSLPSVSEDNFLCPLVSCMEPCTCTGCSLSHENARKAIRFSHRQIHDMECFVNKLMKVLRSMKYILEENSSPQLFPFADSPSRISEMRREVSLDAARLEETTRKWYSVLTKDWKRFCNIMNLSSSQSTSSTIRSRQKKVKFADEVGGLLCHVKVFEKNPALVSL